MKYLVVIGDGMADNPVEALGGKTPLEYADIPTIDSLAARGTVGSVVNLRPFRVHRHGEAAARGQ